MEQRSHDTFTGAIFQVFLQVGKGKNFTDDEERKLLGILPEKHAILRVKN